MMEEPIRGEKSMLRWFSAGLAVLSLATPAVAAEAPPEYQTAKEAERGREEARQRQQQSQRCIDEAALRGDRAHAKKDQLGKKRAALRAKKARALEEMRRGLFCSKCRRTASQIQEAERISFQAHLGKVMGVAIRGAELQRLIDAKAKEFDDKIRSIEDEIRSKETEEKSAAAAMGKCADEWRVARRLEIYAQVIGDWLRRFWGGAPPAGGDNQSRLGYGPEELKIHERLTQDKRGTLSDDRIRVPGVDYTKGDQPTQIPNVRMNESALGRTQLTGLKPDTYRFLEALARAAGNPITLTGAAEHGHARDGEAGSHSSGDRIDIGVERAGRTGITALIQREGKFLAPRPGAHGGDRYMLDRFPGVVFVHEGGGGVPEHWHIEMPGRSFR
jgi:hypothetical protein